MMQQCKSYLPTTEAERPLKTLIWLLLLMTRSKVMPIMP